MKKLITAVAIAMLGAVANAAAITWSATATGTTLSDGSVAAGCMAYMFEGTLSADILSAVAAGTWNESGAIATKAAAANGAVMQTGITKRADGTTGGYANETVDFSMIILNAADYASATEFKYAEVKNVTFVTAGKTAAFATPLQSASWQSISVPEPTSGLLMLIGMAGLALRRRRA